MTEQQPYQVLEHFSNFELRRYPKHVLVQVSVVGDFMSAGNQGFGPLVRYISGNNQTNQRIAMTAPVLQSSETEQRHNVSFVLPEGFDIAQVPLPADARVQIVEVPERRVAALRFSGSWRESRFEDYAEQLRQAVAAAGLKPIDEVYFARYDPPWKPGFLKRNEALIVVAS
jgi:hypothetical protein